MHSDFDQFRTKYMNFPQESSQNINHGQRREMPNPLISSIRKALYTLRDETNAILDLIVEIHSVDLKSVISTDAPALMNSLSNLHEAITLIVTNNASEWIESDSSTSRKILPYPALASLSPDVLIVVTKNLSQIREELDIAADPMMRVQTTSQMIYNHQIAVLTEGGQMQELVSTASFLESLLMP